VRSAAGHLGRLLGGQSEAEMDAEFCCPRGRERGTKRALMVVRKEVSVLSRSRTAVRLNRPGTCGNWGGGSEVASRAPGSPRPPHPP